MTEANFYMILSSSVLLGAAALVYFGPLGKSPEERNRSK
jgi:hypothetical protein